MSIRESELKILPNFSDFPEKALRRIASACVPRTFDKDQTIYFSGQEKERFYLLLSGEVEIYQTGEGKRVVIQALKPGDFFGDLSFTDHAVPLAGSHARAKMETSVCYSMSTADLKLILRSYASFAVLLLTALRDRLHQAESKIKDLAVSSAETRVINELFRYIIRHGRENGGFWQIDKKLTHQSIADMVGIARETTTKVLGALEKEKVISWSNDGFLNLHHENATRVCPQCLMMKTKKIG
jgi:CRP/FNR family transcriptional regulator